MTPETPPPPKTDSAETTLSVCVLASGSKGNAIHISNGRTAILVDAGLSGKEIERRLATRQLRAEALSAIVVSHEHSDHIRGVGVLSRRFGLPVYLSQGTYETAKSVLGRLEAVHPFDCGAPFSIGDLTIHPFSTSHDAEDPAGFTVRHNGIKIGIATDLGIATQMVQQHLKGSSLLIIEANHDPEMLINGPYPWPLKQRIKGRTGHLSNENSTELLKAVMHDKLRHVILAHLSEQNNTPEKALKQVITAVETSDIEVHVALQDTCTNIVTI